MESHKDQPFTVENIPFIPAKVNPNELVDGPFLLYQNERFQLLQGLEHIRENCRISKKDLKAARLPDKYSVLINDGEIYLIYGGVQQGRHAGAGSYGVVKYLQNLRTGEFDQVVKNFSEIHSSPGSTPKKRERDQIKKIVTAEKEQLVQGKQSRLTAVMERISKKKGFQQSVLMIVKQGVQLEEYMDAHTDESFPLYPHLVAIAKNLCTAVNELHQNQGVIHRDIKTANVHIKIATGSVELADFGFAVPIDEVGKVTKIKGTPMNLSPEVISKIKYGAESDAFAVGVTIADMMQFLDDKTGGYVTLKIGKVFVPSALAKKSDVAVNDIENRIYDVCSGLMHPDPNKRMSLADAAAQFELIQKSIPIPVKVVAVNFRELREIFVNSLSDEEDESSDLESSNEANQISVEQKKFKDIIDILTEKNHEIVLVREEGDDYALRDIIDLVGGADAVGLIPHEHLLVRKSGVSNEEFQAALEEHFKKYDPNIYRTCSYFDLKEYNKQNNCVEYLHGVMELISSMGNKELQKYMEYINDNAANNMPNDSILNGLSKLAKSQLKSESKSRSTMFSGKLGKDLQAVIKSISEIDSLQPFTESSVHGLLELSKSMAKPAGPRSSYASDSDS